VRKENPLSRWATTRKGRRHTNIASVTMANTIARLAYAVMTSGKPYDSTTRALANGCSQSRQATFYEQEREERSTDHHALRSVNRTVMRCKASPASANTCSSLQPALAETARMMRTPKRADSIRARWLATVPHSDAG
jgi:hypothetical protein